MENKNYLRSEKLIKEAFLSLREKYDTKDISIKMLTDKAGITRATFYAHYQCISDVAKGFWFELTEDLNSILKSRDFKNVLFNPAPFLYEISKFLNEDERKYSVFVRSNFWWESAIILRNMLIDYFLENGGVPEDVKKDKEFILMLQYISSGIVDLYLEYLRGNLNSNLFDIPASASNFITMGASYIRLKFKLQ